MSDTWGMDYNGGPNHRGICPDCGSDTYTCHDELCESCYDEQNQDYDEPTDEEADNFVSKFNERIDMRLLANDILGSIAGITNEFNQAKATKQIKS